MRRRGLVLLVLGVVFGAAGCPRPGDCLPPPIPAPFQCDGPIASPPSTLDLARRLPDRDDYVGVRVGTSREAPFCALAADGVLECTTGSFDDVATFAVDDAVCVVHTPGLLECDPIGGEQVPSGRTFEEVTVFESDVCALDRQGRELHCGGDPDRGRPTPDPVAFPWRDVTMTGGVACGLDADGRIRCIDQETSGFGVNVGATGMLRYPTDEGFSDLRAGAGFFCAVGAEDRALTCWGNGAFALDEWTPPSPVDDYSLSGGRVCVLSGGRVECGHAAFEPKTEDPVEIEVLPAGGLAVLGADGTLELLTAP